MRLFRHVLTVLVVTLLGAGFLVAPANAAAAPERIITERRPTQVNFTAFQLRGQVNQPMPDGSLKPYALQRVKVQKKKCKKCAWKVIKTIRTNEYGVYKTRIYAPKKGRWRWRARIPASGGYAVTTGNVWTLYVG